ncbi:MAG: NUDIX domain-containing protein [Acidimicrobiales bacterium]
MVGTVTRAEMRSKNLRHRCTYVAVVRTSGALVVHQRADWKDVWPSHWDVCFGGVVGVGESWDDAARRELTEEAGLVAGDLEMLGLVRYDDALTSSAGRVYLVVSDDPLSCPDGEVVQTDEIPIDQLDEWLDGRDVCLDSATVVVPLLRSWAVDFSDDQ